MSTFTEWSGPQGHGFNSKDLINLIEAYNELSIKLNRHIDAVAPTDTVVHGIKAALDALKADLEGEITLRATKNEVNDIRGTIDTLATKQALQNAQQSLGEQIASKADASTVNAKADRVEVNSLRSFAETTRLDLDSLITAWNFFKAKCDVDSATNTLFNTTVESTKALIGKIQARKLIDFVEWSEVNAQYAGTGSQTDTSTNGLYVLGKLSSNWDKQPNPPSSNKFKAARAFIKYENTKPFDAIIDMSCTKTGNGWTGAIRAQVSKEKGVWHGMQFHLVHATDNSGEDAIYLCISADGLAKDSYNSSALNFFVAGINFIPLDEDDAKRIQVVTECACTATVSSDSEDSFATSEISVEEIHSDAYKDLEDEYILNVVTAIDELTQEKYKVLYVGDAEKQPFKDIVFVQKPSFFNPETEKLDYFVTGADIEEIFPVGGMIRWLDDVEVPNGWHRTDGTEINPKYTLLRERLHSDTYPVEENTIIRCELSEVEKSKWKPKPVTSLMQLNEKVQKEIERSVEKDVEHDSGIATNAENITIETTRATAREDELDARITAENERAVGREDEIAANLADTDARLSSEIERATGKDEELAAAIEAEVERATSAEDEIKENLDKLRATVGASLLVFSGELPTETPTASGMIIENNQCAVEIGNGIVMRAEVNEDTGAITWHNTGRTIPENEIPTQVTISLIFNNIPDADKAEIDGKKIDAPKHSPYNGIRLTANIYVYSLEDAAVYKAESIDDQGNITWVKVDIVETVNLPVYAELDAADKAMVDGKLVNLPKSSPYNHAFFNIGMQAVSLNDDVFSLYEITAISDTGLITWSYIRDIVPVNL